MDNEKEIFLLKNSSNGLFSLSPFLMDVKKKIDFCCGKKEKRKMVIKKKRKLIDFHLNFFLQKRKRNLSKKILRNKTLSFMSFR